MILTAYIYTWTGKVLFVPKHFCNSNIIWQMSLPLRIHQLPNGSVSAQTSTVICLQSSCFRFVLINVQWISIINLVFMSQAISIMRNGLFHF